jgi:hypothetical protein
VEIIHDILLWMLRPYDQIVPIHLYHNDTVKMIGQDDGFVNFGIREKPRYLAPLMINDFPERI